MGTDEDGEQDADTLVPDALRLNSQHQSSFSEATSPHNESIQPRQRYKMFSKPGNKNVRRRKAFRLEDWSWLSSDSPLMSSRSENEWLLERLCLVLERELDRTRKGIKRPPPVGWSDLRPKDHAED